MFPWDLYSYFAWYVVAAAAAASKKKGAVVDHMKKRYEKTDQNDQLKVNVTKQEAFAVNYKGLKKG